MLSRVNRVFKDIPETIEIDLFGEIYEFFLGEFTLNEGKDGGTFYTPSSVVRYMVEVIKPESGEKMFLDSKTTSLIQSHYRHSCKKVA